MRVWSNGVGFQLGIQLSIQQVFNWYSTAKSLRCARSTWGVVSEWIGFKLGLGVIISALVWIRVSKDKALLYKLAALMLSMCYPNGTLNPRALKSNYGCATMNEAS